MIGFPERAAAASRSALHQYYRQEVHVEGPRRARRRRRLLVGGASLTAISDGYAGLEHNHMAFSLASILGEVH